jgi:hypothetical protein
MTPAQWVIVERPSPTPGVASDAFVLVLRGSAASPDAFKNLSKKLWACHVTVGKQMPQGSVRPSPPCTVSESDVRQLVEQGTPKLWLQEKRHCAVTLYPITVASASDPFVKRVIAYYADEERKLQAKTPSCAPLCLPSSLPTM